MCPATGNEGGTLRMAARVDHGEETANVNVPFGNLFLVERLAAVTHLLGLTPSVD